MGKDASCPPQSAVPFLVNRFVARAMMKLCCPVSQIKYSCLTHCYYRMWADMMHTSSRQEAGMTLSYSIFCQLDEKDRKAEA